MNPQWRLRKFDELTTTDLYEILRLRERVFIVEQKCPYPDCDGKDFDALHLTGHLEGKLVAYSRLLGPGVRFPEVSIGRVVVAPEFRRQSLGRKLTLEALAGVREAFGPVPVRISAQAYLEKFYSDLGFKRVSDEYMEDWIPHIEMLHD